MANVDRIVARWRQHPAQVPLRDVYQVLEAYDYRLHHITGSHHVFVKPGSPSVSVPTISGRHVKRVYVKTILALLGLE
jgi:predicted RNA binding protein YcfA (HicA-like mRNA interferase family)